MKRLSVVSCALFCVFSLLLSGCGYSCGEVSYDDVSVREAGPVGLRYGDNFTSSFLVISSRQSFQNSFNETWGMSKKDQEPYHDEYFQKYDLLAVSLPTELPVYYRVEKLEKKGSILTVHLMEKHQVVTDLKTAIYTMFIHVPKGELDNIKQFRVSKAIFYE